VTTSDASNPHYVGDFGDERLAEVGADLLRALEEKRTVVVKRLGGTRAEEIRYGRFLKNENVTHQEILDVEGRRVGRRVKGRDVLAIQDTTEMRPARPANVHLLTRASQNRCLANGDYLFETMKKKPVVCRYMIDIPQKIKRKARQAKVALRYGVVELRRPTTSRKTCDVPTVRLTAVFCRRNQSAARRGSRAVDVAYNP